MSVQAFLVRKQKISTRKHDFPKNGALQPIDELKLVSNRQSNASIKCTTISKN